MVKNLFSFTLLAYAFSVFAQSGTLRANTDQMFLNASAPRNYILNSGAQKNDLNVTDSSGIHSRSTSSPLTGDASHLIDGTSTSQNVDFLGSSLQPGLLGVDCEASFTLSGDATLYSATVRINSADVTTALTLSNTGSYSRPVSILFPCGTSGVSPVLRITSNSASAAAIKIDDVYLGKAVSLGTSQQIGDWQSYTPTFTGAGTVSVQSFWSRRVGDTLQIKGKFTSGTSTGTEARITIGYAGSSANVTIDGTKNPSIRVVGTWAADTTTSTAVKAVLAEPSVSYLTFGYNITTIAELTKQNGNALFASGAQYTIEAEVPILGWTSQPITNTNMPYAPTVQKFASGTGTYTTPAGVQFIRVRMVGGGGGGGGGGTSSGTGGTGGISYFRVGASPDLLVANGGTGGVGNDGSGGAGGSASLGTGPIGLIQTGSSGRKGSTSPDASGYGGNAPFFAGGGSGAGAGITGGNGVTNSGGGGQGGSGSGGNTTGGGGGSGGYVEAFITNPSTTYAYNVGAAGTAGTGSGGGGPTNGGTGAVGYIEVTEFYSTAMPAIIGSVTSNSTGAERIERGWVNTCASSTCTITTQSGTWLSSVTRTSTGRYVANFTAGIFASAPTCVIVGGEGPATYNTFPTTSNVDFTIRGSAFAATDSSVFMTCMGPR